MRLLWGVVPALVIVVLGAWIILRNEKGEEIARIEIPDGGSVELAPPPENPSGGQHRVAQVAPQAAAELAPSKFYSAHDPQAELKQLADDKGLKIRSQGSSASGSGPTFSKDAELAIAGSAEDLKKIMDQYHEVVKKQMTEHGIDETNRGGSGEALPIREFCVMYDVDGRSGLVRVVGAVGPEGMIAIDVFMYEHAAAP